MPAPTTKKRADGYYQRSITTGYDKKTGKQLRKVIYAKTIKELDAKEAEYRAQAHGGAFAHPEKITFGDIAALWLSDYKPTIGVNTRRMYEAYIKHLHPLENVHIKNLKPHDLQAIINGMAATGYAERTMKGVKNTAVQILDIAVQNDALMRNPFARVDIPHKDANKRRALTPEEIELITRCTSHRMALPVNIMLYCGLRRGEVLSLKWRDIDLKNNVIILAESVEFDGNAARTKTPKTKAGTRRIPIPAILRPLLDAHRGIGSAPVCPSASGDIMTQSAYKRAWDSYLHYLNIEAGGSDKKQVHITAHMLRHTYATMLYEAGVDVKSAQAFLGHADLQTTLKIYTHLSEQKKATAVDALNSYLSSKKSTV